MLSCHCVSCCTCQLAFALVSSSYPLRICSPLMVVLWNNFTKYSPPPAPPNVLILARTTQIHSKLLFHENIITMYFVKPCNLCPVNSPLALTGICVIYYILFLPLSSQYHVISNTFTVHEWNDFIFNLSFTLWDSFSNYSFTLVTFFFNSTLVMLLVLVLMESSGFLSSNHKLNVF